MPKQIPAVPQVDFTRQEVLNKQPLWERIKAATEGEEAVKVLGDKILPRPNPADVSIPNQKRFDSYIARAVWYNVSARTLNGLTGYVFAKEPTVNLPAELKPLETNIDGSGVTLQQQAKNALRNVLAYGRGGLLVDYPTVERATTKQDLLDGNVSPTIVLYGPEAIINWRTSHTGAKTFLDLLVLKETFVASGKDEFEMTVRTQYRVLSRTPEGVTGRMFRQTDGEGPFVEQTDLGYRTSDKAGNPLKEIPFAFLGAVNNDPEVDTPPLNDLVNLNLAHFRNSADHEEACFMVGQPTPWIAGLTAAWVKDQLKGEVHLGSRAIIPLPQGGSAGLLQATANTMPFEAMKHKELQMVALGAKLVEQSTVQRTATEAGMDHSSEVSTLTAAATNVFLAYKQALTFCALFVGNGEGQIEFELSEPLTKDIITPEQATAIMALWMGGLVDYEEARFALKKSGLAWKKDEDVKAASVDDGLRAPPTLPPAAKPAPGAPPPPQPKPKA